jgi:hypothetical protein
MPKLEENTAELAVVLGRCKPQDAPGAAVRCAMSIAAYGRRMVKRNIARCNVQDYDMARASRLDAQDMQMIRSLLEPFWTVADQPFVVVENTNGVTPAFTIFYEGLEFRF